MPCGNPEPMMNLPQHIEGYRPQFQKPRKVQEDYDPNSNVCASQPTFQDALKDSLDNINKDNMKKVRPWLIVYVVLWLVFVIWGILLAVRISNPAERVVHVMFAVVFGPMYVLAQYISMLGKSNGAVMGMCGMKY